VAAEPLFVSVEGERDRAIRAAGDVAAERALEGGRVPAAIQEEHHLLAAFEALEDGLAELRRKDGVGPSPCAIRRRSMTRTMGILALSARLGEFEQAVLAALRALK
jgi:hypothetical protein